MESIAERIRSEAAIADRPGQLARLEALADEVEALTADLAAADRKAPDLHRAAAKFRTQRDERRA